MGNLTVKLQTVLRLWRGPRDVDGQVDPLFQRNPMVDLGLILMLTASVTGVAYLLLLGTGSGKIAEAHVQALSMMTEGAPGKEIAKQTPYGHIRAHLKEGYYCPLHPEVIATQPGACPVCGQPYVYFSQPVANQTQRQHDGAIVNTGHNLYVEKKAYVEGTKERVRDILPPIEGRVENLAVSIAGSWVKKGDLLLALYSKQLMDMELEYLRALKRNDAVMQTAMWDRMMAQGMAVEDLQRLKSQRQADGLMRLYSPVNGMVSAINVQEGQQVTGYTEAIKLLDLHSVWLAMEVSPDEVAIIEPKQRVEVKAPMAVGGLLVGEVEEVVMDKKYGKRIAYLRFEDTQKLLPAKEYVKVKVYTSAPKENALQNEDS